MFIYNEDHTITLRLADGTWVTYHESELDLVYFVVTSNVRPAPELRAWGVSEISPESQDSRF